MRKLTTQDFIDKAVLVHGNKYDYSLANYVSNSIKITIICPLHGSFKQQANNHLNGQGCPTCGRSRSDTLRIKTTEWFITKAQKLFGTLYDYSKTVYKNSKTKLIITCPVHGEFEQLPASHLQKHGCGKCSPETGMHTKRLSTFIKKASDIHNNKYTYEVVNYKTAHIPVLITCPAHGQFLQSPNNHIKGRGCPACNKSKGELAIKTWLINQGLVFEEEKTFSRCINPITGWKLRFDFYIPSKNLLIEYQGIQHYQPTDFAGKGKVWSEKNFNGIIKLDKIKVGYCKKHNIQLLSIPYTKLDTIETILTTIL